MERESLGRSSFAGRRLASLGALCALTVLLVSAPMVAAASHSVSAPVAAHPRTRGRLTPGGTSDSGIHVIAGSDWRWVAASFHRPPSSPGAPSALTAPPASAAASSLATEEATALLGSSLLTLASETSESSEEALGGPLAHFADLGPLGGEWPSPTGGA